VKGLGRVFGIIWYKEFCLVIIWHFSLKQIILKWIIL